MTELAREMDNAHTHVGAVVHKRRGVGDISSQYVTMDLMSFVQLFLWAWKG